MKALKFENGRLFLAEAKIPQIADEVLVKVTTSGICNTDLEIVRGYAGFEGIIGHEFVGVVEKAPGAEKLIGKRVVGEINAGCGKCDRCRGNDARHCLNRTVLGIIGRDGAHAEFLSLPAENLLVVPDSITDEQAVFVEPLAAANAITEQVEIAQNTRVAVIGDGKLGILCARVLALKCERLVLIGKHRAKLDRAGAGNIEPVLLTDAKKFRRKFDVVVEASGSESGFGLALDIIRPRGKLVLKSTFKADAKPEMWRVVVDEITVVGSRCGRFEPAIKLLEDRSIDPSDLIDSEYDLSHGVAAMEAAAAKGAMKVLLRNGPAINR